MDKKKPTVKIKPSNTSKKAQYTKEQLLNMKPEDVPESHKMLLASFKNPNTGKGSAISKGIREKQEERKLETQFQDKIKEQLLKQIKLGGKTTIWAEKLIDAAAKAAIKNPNGKAAERLLDLIMPVDSVMKIDEVLEEQIAKDLDFHRYRVTKDCFSKQTLVITDNVSKRKLLGTGRRSGKTVTAHHTFIYQAILGNQIMVYCHVTFSNAILQCFSQVVEVSKKVGLPIIRSSKVSGIIEWANGSILYFKGTNDTRAIEKLRGNSYDLVWIDEAQSMYLLRNLIDDVVTPTLVDRSGTLIVSGTPPRIRSTYFEKLFFNKTWYNFCWNMYENPHIKNVEDFILFVCKEKGVEIDDPLIQREYLGTFGAYDTEAQLFRKKEYFEELLPEFVPTGIMAGLDPGFMDNNAIGLILYNVSTREKYLVEESQWNKAGVERMAEECTKIRDKAIEYAGRFGLSMEKFFIVSDTNEPTVRATLREMYGLPMVAAWKGEALPQIQIMIAEVASGRLKVKKGGFLDIDFDNTLYKRKDDDTITTVIDDGVYHPDMLHAVRYCLRNIIVEENAYKKNNA